MFKKILIANRGEIACRIHRTAQRMGIKTVAVYSDADRHALHRHLLDEAVYIGEPPARESYLVMDRLIAAAKDKGAEAIHPGYGFLSENADFAEAVKQAGLIFIGPDPHSIRAMGSKSAAKEMMVKANVPVVPGYHGADQEDAIFIEKAEEIGYPVLIKAAMGGGGKGMRRVDRREDLSAALAGARREALSSFGDQALLIEKYLRKPRHIEMQIFGDCHGNIVHLFERDCSLQRRHQKVIEEAPAPGFDARARARLAQSAIAAAKAVDYVGAGTVEFIAEADNLDQCYFMEMNTRLQVEHPVTEMITGLDLVEWQLRIAAGEPLPQSQSEIAIDGHAIEMRICAEDPARDYLPSIGKIHYFAKPLGTGIRCDSGIGETGEVTSFYDSMIAKLIVHGGDRAHAIELAEAAIAETHIAGITTNLDLLAHLLRQEDFSAGEVETGFIPNHPFLPSPKLPPQAIALIAANEWAKNSISGEAVLESSSPWNLRDGWRLDGPSPITFWIRDKESNAYRAVMHSNGVDIETIEVNGEAVSWTEENASHTFITAKGAWRWLTYPGGRYQVEMLGNHPGLEKKGTAAGKSSGRLIAPMPGKIIQLLASEGEQVESGQAVVVLEAMKMEHRLAAPRAGKVVKIDVKINEQVGESAFLMEISDA